MFSFKKMFNNLEAESLKQSREIIELRHEVYELKKMTTKLISRLDKLNK